LKCLGWLLTRIDNYFEVHNDLVTAWVFWLGLMRGGSSYVGVYLHYFYCMFAGIGQGKSNGPSKPVTTDSILSMVVLVV
jgi:hypothetical protein